MDAAQENSLQLLQYVDQTQRDVDQTAGAGCRGADGVQGAEYGVRGADGVRECGVRGAGGAHRADVT